MIPVGSENTTELEAKHRQEFTARREWGMTTEQYAFRLLLLTVSGWVTRHQQEVLEYLVEENRVLKEQLKGRRLRLTDDQRRPSYPKTRPLS